MQWCNRILVQDQQVLEEAPKCAKPNLLCLFSRQLTHFPQEASLTLVRPPPQLLSSIETQLSERCPIPRHSLPLPSAALVVHIFPHPPLAIDTVRRCTSVLDVKQQNSFRLDSLPLDPMCWIERPSATSRSCSLTHHLTLPSLKRRPGVAKGRKGSLQGGGNTALSSTSNFQCFKALCFLYVPPWIQN